MSHKFIVVIGAIATLANGAAGAQPCGFTPAFSRPDERGTRQLRVYEGRAEAAIGGRRPLLFITSLKVNTDGTRISYHKDDPRAQRLAINNIRNAMRRGTTIAQFENVAAAGWPLPRTWQILSANVIERRSGDGKPCVDSSGYLVSMTSDVAVDGGWNRVGDCDQAKWIDALAIPALVLPGGATQFAARGAAMRTPVIAMTLAPVPTRVAYGIVGDAGPADELGEASVAMNRVLNGFPAGANPRNYADAVARFQAPRSAILLFPGPANRVARPLTSGRVEARTRQLFDAWGGQVRLRQCLTELGMT